MKCRHCHEQLEHTFLDLGFAPPSNAYLSEAQLKEPEIYYPLKLKVCTNCWLVQTEDYAKAEDLFSSDYAYFSSTSTSWLRHAELYSASIIERLSLDEDSMVIEVASNDGYLLKNFLARKIPCLGIEPTESTASAAEKLGVPVLRQFFSEELGLGLKNTNSQADLIIGNNVYAHVPDINDFTRGLKKALKAGGTITLEFPHLMRLIEKNQFDTVYHEHFSYLSLLTVVKIFSEAGLCVVDVEELETHGGSLRVYGTHLESAADISIRVKNILDSEVAFGLNRLSTYQLFQDKVDETKNCFLSFLIEQKKIGKKVVAYGAAAKGNTFLNYAGVKADLISYVCDAASSKQGKYLPGSHIKIVAPSMLEKLKPDIIVIFPWNIESEIREQNRAALGWGCRFIVAIPELRG